MRQTTIRETSRVDGVNVFTGRKNHAVIHPAKEGEGIVFHYQGESVPATLENAAYLHGWRLLDHSISLRGQSRNIRLIEHFLPALVQGLGIDNVHVELSDGTCPTTEFVTLEVLAGLEGKVVPIEGSRRKIIEYDGKDFNYHNNGRPDNLTVSEGDGLSIKAEINYPHAVLAGNREFETKVTPKIFKEKLAAARSPAFTGNKLGMYALGLVGLLPVIGHGVTRRNYLLVLGKKAEDYGNPKMCGVRYNGAEFIRHKALDCLCPVTLGALELGGRWDNTRFSFSCTGHKFDLTAMRKLLDSGQVREE